MASLRRLYGLDDPLGGQHMKKRDCDVVIIGAGTAGLKAYKAAVARGADALIVERGPGGSTCTRVGCMPSKLLIAAARSADQARKAVNFGVMIGEVTIDAAQVWRRVRQERDRFVASVLEEYHAIPAEHRVHGDARFTDADTVAIGDDRITAAEGIVIATGARPIIPDVLDPVLHLVHTHETIFELDALPVSLAVLGAGPLGLELGQAFARLGVAVTIIDKGETVAGLKDSKVNAAAIEALSAEMTIRLGVDASVCANDEGGARLSLPEGDIDVDLILAATGRSPSLDKLDLASAGIELDDHGTPLFDKTTRRCGDSKIFIAGDANAWRPVLHEAARGGQIAGTVAMGGSPGRSLPAFAVAFTDPNLVEVGMSFDALPENARIGEATVTDNGRATVDGSNRGLVRLYAAADGKLLGGSIAAPAGEHLGHLVALAIERGMDAAAFEDQAWYHPTEEEMLQGAVRDILGQDS
jgi:dihydrolipoamide dehydrogenase